MKSLLNCQMYLETVSPSMYFTEGITTEEELPHTLYEKGKVQGLICIYMYH